MIVYVKNKLFSMRGSSEVLDQSGNPVFTVKGKFFSITNKKRVMDMSGNVLYTVRNRWINLFAHKVFVADENKKRIATVRNKVFSLKSHYFVEGKIGEIEIVGEFFKLTSQILCNGKILGIIRREVTLFADSFELEASEEDMPLCIALVIAIDNICDAIRRSTR